MSNKPLIVGDLKSNTIIGDATHIKYIFYICSKVRITYILNFRALWHFARSAS
jgi:hypothetical protein